MLVLSSWINSQWKTACCAR